METTAFFERKLGISPKEMNTIQEKNIDAILLEQLDKKLGGKCSEHGFVIPNSIKIISRSMGYYDQSNFTGDTNYYVKAEARVLNSIDEMNIVADVIRKNKMGLYANYRDALRIIVPRDLHIGNEEFESVQIGNRIELQLKKSKYQINDPYILSSGLFIRKLRDGDSMIVGDGAEESKTYE
jgi:hypothetical protein